MSKIEIETKDINVSSLILDENVNETEQMKESDVETNVVDFERDTDGNIKYHNRTHNRKTQRTKKRYVSNFYRKSR